MGLKFRTYPIGQDVLTLEFQGLTPLFLRQIMSGLRAHFGQHLDILAVNGSLTLFEKNISNSQTDIEEFLSGFRLSEIDKPHCWELAVHYNGADLEALSLQLGLSTQQIIELHQSQTYTIEGFGFLPGFFYASGLPKSLHLARKNTPALRVPPRSVAIAGGQTGVYPVETSGGWHVLGEIAFDLFDHRSQPPMLMNVGDELRFKSVTKQELNEWSQAWMQVDDRKRLLSCSR